MTVPDAQTRLWFCSLAMLHMPQRTDWSFQSSASEGTPGHVGGGARAEGRKPLCLLMAWSPQVPGVQSVRPLHPRVSGEVAPGCPSLEAAGNWTHGDTNVFTPDDSQVGRGPEGNSRAEPLTAWLFGEAGVLAAGRQ